MADDAATRVLPRLLRLAYYPLGIRKHVGRAVGGRCVYDVQALSLITMRVLRDRDSGPCECVSSVRGCSWYFNCLFTSICAGSKYEIYSLDSAKRESLCRESRVSLALSLWQPQVSASGAPRASRHPASALYGIRELSPHKAQDGYTGGRCGSGQCRSLPAWSSDTAESVCL